MNTETTQAEAEAEQAEINRINAEAEAGGDDEVMPPELDEAEREAEAMAELDEPEAEPKAAKPDYPCELCKERERMRTLPYCDECAASQGYLP
jgi:hypothetical protein